MKKLPVAGPTYDYKLENIRNDIIEQELALCLKRQEDLAINSTIVDGDGNTTTLRANLNTEFYTRTEADTAIASATTSLVSETALNTALGDYTNTATLNQNFYTKTDADSAIASATLNLVSTSDLNTALGDYTNTATLNQNFYTKTDADSAISSAITTNNVSLGNTYGTIESVQAVEGDVDGIEGKYAVKIDNNGYVSGFGLISTANDATPFSTFTISADAFKIVDTSTATDTPYSPFKVYTTTRTVDGVTVPKGVYIEDVHITNALIETLDAGSVNFGTLDDARLPGLVREASGTYTATINDAGSISFSANLVSLTGVTVGNKVLITMTATVSYGSVTCYVSPVVIGAPDPFATSVGLSAGSSATGTVSVTGSGTATATTVSAGLTIIPAGSATTNRDYNINVSILEFIK